MEITKIMHVVQCIEDTQTCFLVDLESLALTFNTMKLDLNYGANLTIFMDEITMCSHPSI
jgi:hypothetical protein